VKKHTTRRAAHFGGQLGKSSGQGVGGFGADHDEQSSNSEQQEAACYRFVSRSFDGNLGYTVTLVGWVHRPFSRIEEAQLMVCPSPPLIA
jgi:hypothetical protein